VAVDSPRPVETEVARAFLGRGEGAHEVLRGQHKQHAREAAERDGHIQHRQHREQKRQEQTNAAARDSTVHEHAVVEPVGDAPGIDGEQERKQSVHREQDAGLEGAGAEIDGEQRGQHPAALERYENRGRQQQNEGDAHWLQL
jgi:hypothetical protein